MNTRPRQYKESTTIAAPADAVFLYADDHRNFSSHMNKSSWMMAGSKMETELDAGEGRRVGSHIRMSGKVFGIDLFLDEVVTLHEPLYHKAWQTIGDIHLLIIGQYTMGFDITQERGACRFTVFIDYDLPQSPMGRLLGYMLGGIYARWCVRQMLGGVIQHFTKKSSI